MLLLDSACQLTKFFSNYPSYLLSPFLRSVLWVNVHRSTILQYCFSSVILQYNVCLYFICLGSCIERVYIPKPIFCNLLREPIMRFYNMLVCFLKCISNISYDWLFWVAANFNESVLLLVHCESEVLGLGASIWFGPFLVFCCKGFLC